MLVWARHAVLTRIATPALVMGRARWHVAAATKDSLQCHVANLGPDLLDIVGELRLHHRHVDAAQIANSVDPGCRNSHVTTDQAHGISAHTSSTCYRRRLSNYTRSDGEMEFPPDMADNIVPEITCHIPGSYCGWVGCSEPSVSASSSGGARPPSMTGSEIASIYLLNV